MPAGATRWPRTPVKRSAIWHRKLLTPLIGALVPGMGHMAIPSMDSSLGHGFAELALFYREADPDFASELMGLSVPANGNGFPHHAHAKNVTAVDLSIPAKPVAEMDWAVGISTGRGHLRDGETAGEFLSAKAGRHGHVQR